MKKVVSVLLATIISLTMIMPSVYAADTDKMEEILVSVKERINVPEEYTEFSSRYETMYGITMYYFSWSEEETGKSVNVECFDDGIISSYRCYGTYNYSDEPKIPEVSREEARLIAENFLSDVNPDFPYEIRLADNENASLYGGGYTFYTETYVNGIRLADGNGTVHVNGETGDIRSFNLNYVPIEYPSVENAISVEDAKKAYSEKLGLELVYRTYTEDKEEIAYPVYVQRYSYGKYIDALTGDVYDQSEVTSDTNAMYSMGAAKEESAADSLTPEERQEISNIDGLISKEDIEKQIKDNKVLSVPEAAQINNISLSKSYNSDEYFYTMYMSADEESFYISANAHDGTIISYNRYGKNENSENAHNDEDFKALAGDKTSEYKYNEENGIYERYVNGIRVSGDTAQMKYDDKVLTWYSISYSDVEFPSIEGVMSAQDAEGIMFEKDGYEMLYMLEITKESIRAVPVYRHNTVSINPFTGKYVNYRNEEETEETNKIEYSDIENHYAQKYINELAYYGIGFEGGEFRPDEKITQKDFLALLTAVYQNGIIVLKEDKEQSDSVYRTSYSNDIISEEERDDDAVVTREMASVYMIRAMGAEEYAKHDDIYVSVFDDVTENKGYIALLSAMGVVNGDGNGNFNPDKEITRAESTVMIYNYLTK